MRTYQNKYVDIRGISKHRIFQSTCTRSACEFLGAGKYHPSCTETPFEITLYFSLKRERDQINIA